MALFIAAFVLFAALSIKFSAGWGFAAAGIVLIYALWNAAFSCPACGTPYLWEMKGIFVVPTSFPLRCRKCGRDTRLKRHDG